MEEDTWQTFMLPIQVLQRTKLKYTINFSLYIYFRDMRWEMWEFFSSRVEKKYLLIIFHFPQAIFTEFLFSGVTRRNLDRRFYQSYLLRLRCFLPKREFFCCGAAYSKHFSNGICANGNIGSPCKIVQTIGNWGKTYSSVRSATTPSRMVIIWFVSILSVFNIYYLPGKP